MTRISRPLQIALAAMVLFAAVWFIALRPHSSGGESASSPAPQAPAAAPASSGPSSPTSGSYHGSAPGVAGLTRAITKARHAAALAEHEGPAGEHTGTSDPARSATPAKAHARPSHAAKPSPRQAKHASSAKSTPAADRAIPPLQRSVEAQLHQGKIVAILFWNPRGSVDSAVHRELQSVGHQLGGALAVHSARSSQVGSFGAITRSAQIYSTPTILMINRHGQSTTIDGLTDSFAIKQAIGEVKHGL